MHENEIAKLIVAAAFKIHTTLGPGLLESVYESVLIYELEKNLREEARGRGPFTIPLPNPLPQPLKEGRCGTGALACE